MRADRLISILLLLQTQRRATARELAARLEVSERTVQRDMEALGMAGVPVLAERGAGGGWSLLESYRTNLTGLNLSEIQALFVANPSQLMADLGLRQASDAALLKLLAALPGTLRRDAEFVRQRIHIDGASWKQEPEDVTCLPVIQDAIWQERKLLLVYQRHDSPVERLVDPLGLVSKGSAWYLVAAVEGDFRTYRVSRIRSASITEQPAARPPDFDLAAFWNESSAQFKAALPRYPATFRVDPEIMPHMNYMGRVEQVGEPDSNDWVRVEMVFEVEEQARAFALGYGGQLEVLAPPELREKVIQLARATVEMYQERS